MSNLSKDLILDGYWVNKKSGTIHWVSESKSSLVVVRSYGVKLLILDIIEIISSMKRSVML